MKTISSEKVKRFQTYNPKYFREGLSEDVIQKIKPYLKECPWVVKFYWKEAKSYIFNDTLTGETYCITKSYFGHI